MKRKANPSMLKGRKGPGTQSRGSEKYKIWSAFAVFQRCLISNKHLRVSETLKPGIAEVVIRLLEEVDICLFRKKTMEELRPVGLANFWHRKPGPPHFPVQKRPQHRKPAFPWPDYEYEPCSDPEDLELRWEQEIRMAGDPKKNDECPGDLFSDSDLDIDSEPESNFG